ncbi:hypothetical protein L0663_04915 [Dyadobacter sp. CY107]|uniref:hypothetical protein n=1 Tax=Dyadobacter fanqingshengii TaxID=2906443 RepID=UPI001F19E124|nr:hypothetical protein [Dyadobacter fanqingshengii]MCF2502707.1 hypothetical protein [Dyadobacter fanqingshengii]
MTNKLLCFTILLCSLFLFTFSKSENGKKKITLAEVPEELARTDVTNFFAEYPDSVGKAPNRYPSSKFHVVYAVHFLKKPDELAIAYPDIDFSEITKLYPKGANGVRIYEAVSYGKKKSGDALAHPIGEFKNYLTFTKHGTDPNFPADDILNHVYLIKNHHFDLRSFREKRGSKLTKDGVTHHLSCAPQCPRGSSLIRR